MNRCKKKAGHDDHVDRISDLPSNVIDGILQHLPIPDLVRTSILSRKWRYTWASVPQLEFENHFFAKCKHLEYLETSSIITEVLLLHNGPVHTFILHIPSNYPIKMECLNKWILFLSRNGIKELELVNRQTYPFQTPSHIFSCQDLTYLELQDFKLSTAPNFRGFKSLLDLHLYNIRFEPNALESLMSSCPLLVELIVSYCSGFDCINVSAPTLEVLHVEGDQVIKSICLEKAKNLTDLNLVVDRLGDNFERDRVFDLIKGFPKIKNICIGGGYVQIFSIGIVPQMFQRSVNCLKYLELNAVNLNKTRELLFIISLLESSPNLEELYLKGSSNREFVGPRPILHESECNNCCLSQLRIVTIIVTMAYKTALNLIHFLLANSTSLEILTFKVGLGLKQSDAPKLLSISRDLLQMERASQRAKVKFLYDGLIE